MLRGQFQPHVGRADAVQPLLNYALGKFGFVALAAQVAQIQVAKAGRHDVGGAVGSSFV